MSSNLLGRETSPYLLQHKDNPVHWRPWGPAALAEAQAQDKPILLSVGYAACHWCHVMAHESFEDPATAALMNALFVTIKVDREERPDIDAIYQHALALTGQQGGWPLTMFLTPIGQPYWGGTYFPPAPRGGHPGFPDVLRHLAGAYRNEKAQIARNTAALLEGLEQLSASPPGKIDITPDLLDKVAQDIAARIDPRHGGIGHAPKFPHCAALELVWRGFKRSGNEALRDAVLLTLDRMAQGGIYDHLGGGFARYSTDDRWLVPHFEKMLYDNAQLLGLLTAAWQETASPLYAARVAETIGWLLREMRQPGGGFAATIDADSEHEEGKFYVWSETEIDRLLGDRAALFKAHYDVTPGGNWEGRTILNRSARPSLAEPETEIILAQCREILLAARETRIRPGLDDKILADWNGLTIAALARAGEAFARPDWIAAAIEAWDFVTTTLAAGNGRLSHSWCRGRTHPGNLDDHAAMALAGIALTEATGEERYLAQSRAWAAELDAHFHDAGAGGYFFTAADTESLITRTRSVTDNATPSGNGMLVGLFARLWHHSGEPAYRTQAERQIDAFSGEIERNLFPLATFLNGAELLADAVQVAIIGDPARPDTAALRAVGGRIGLPNRVLTLVRPGAALPAGHPAAGKPLVAGAATAYVCRGSTCSAPVTTPDALAALLSRP